MRVALVHDDLVQWGGAERVLLGLCEIYPDAPIYTSVFDGENKMLRQMFGSKKIITSFLQKIPCWRSLYKILLPFYPIAFEQFDFSEFDLVISHTTRFSKSIITKPETVHVCYCHTPPRFLWHFSGEGNYGLAELLMSKLRLYDQISSRRVDAYIAGSENAKRRIKKVYGVDSKIVYPCIDLKRFKDVDTFNGGYFLVISRLNKYKKVDLAIEACIKLGIPLKVIGRGPELERLRGIQGVRGEIEFLGNLGDEMVVQVLAGCKALIIPGIEDFGLTVLEAQALGKPVISFNQGGVLETVTDGITGIFFDSQSSKSIVLAIKKLETLKIAPNKCRENVKLFSKENFIHEFRQTVAGLM